jgi:hypothetical protein
MNVMLGVTKSSLFCKLALPAASLVVVAGSLLSDPV